jgi:hypothetical protein
MPLPDTFPIFSDPVSFYDLPNSQNGLTLDCTSEGLFDWQGTGPAVSGFADCYQTTLLVARHSLMDDRRNCSLGIISLLPSNMKTIFESV